MEPHDANRRGAHVGLARRSLKRQQYDQGGVLFWANSDDLAGIAKNVRGVTVAPVGYLNYFRLAEGWIAR